MTVSRIAYLVGGTARFRQALARMLRATGFSTQAFAKAGDLGDALSYLDPGCILLDTDLPDKGALALLNELGELRPGMPVIVMDAKPSTRTAVRMIKAGAIDYLEIPFSDDAVVAVLEDAFQQLPGRVRREVRACDARLKAKRLTPRERDVLNGMLGGHTNREIGDRIGISIRTVEMHRGNIMHKFEVDSLTALMRACLLAQLSDVE